MKKKCEFPEYKKISYRDIETSIYSFWKEKKIFEKSVSSRDDAKVFSFCEGPPTVNGLPGIHHVFSRTVKDIVCRYKTLCGYQVPRQAGWDTHGLPVEVAVEKKLGLKNNSHVTRYGLENFCKEARTLVYSHIKDEGYGWRKLTEDMGYWCDLDRAYVTCSNDYIESVWWSIQQIFNKGMIYKDYKIVPQDPKSESVLSTHELALGYKDVKDPSVYIKFKRKDVDEYFLVWTTTPWTLISNMFLSVNPSVVYVRVSYGNEVLILAEDRIDVLNTQEEGRVEVLERFYGRDLANEQYEPLYRYMKTEAKTHFVALADFVTTEDGTGIVHCAPAFGVDDYEVAKRYNVPLFQPIARNGYFTKEAPLVENKFFKDADPVIIDDLKSRNALFRKETIVHNYPFSWRYDVPVIYYARESWYIATSKIVDKLVLLNKKINWVPAEVGSGRFGNWLVDNKDWALSRDRFWGTPLPIWISKDFKIGSIGSNQDVICIGSIEELKQGFIDLDSTQYLLSDAIERGLVSVDLHKPFVDQVYFVKEGKKFVRTPEVIDAWYDSGAVPFAQYHYPFENKEKFESRFPIDFIAEGVDQTRGWFYTLHAISALLFDSEAYRNVISLGLLLDKKGQKMSKSKGNVKDPFLMMEKYGADTVRLCLVLGNKLWLPTRFSENFLLEVQKKFFRAFLESYKFFSLYANLDAFSYKDSVIGVEKRSELDRWVISRMNSLTRKVRESMEGYELSVAAVEISDFVIHDLSNWYIRRSRRRFWKDVDIQDKMSAYQTLYECLCSVCKLIAPFAPFLADQIYKNLNDNEKVESFESVHLSTFPTVDNKKIDSKLEISMRKVQVVSSLARTIRERISIKIRQPLQRILIVVSSSQEKDMFESKSDLLQSEINVHEIIYVSTSSDIVKKLIKPNFKSLGPKFGKKVNEVVFTLKNLDERFITELEQQGYLDIGLDGDVVRIQQNDVEIIYHGIEGWAVERDSAKNITIALDTVIDEKLKEEGMAREFVSKVQNVRKVNLFDVSDRITINLMATSKLKSAVLAHEDYIKEETLAKKLNITHDMIGGIVENVNGEECQLDIIRNN